MELEPGWDGFGAEPIYRRAVNECLRILEGTVKLSTSSSDRELFIAPLPDGGLELDWDLPMEEELMVVVPPEGGPVRFLLTTTDHEGNEREREGKLGIDDTLINLFSGSSN